MPTILDTIQMLQIFVNTLPIDIFLVGLPVSGSNRTNPFVNNYQLVIALVCKKTRFHEQSSKLAE